MTDTKLIELPAPQLPMVTMVISNTLFPPDPPKYPPNTPPHLIPPPPPSNLPVMWVTGKPHPFMGGANIVRMFITDDGVDIYSVSKDGTSAARDTVPMEQVRLIQEAMTIDLFVKAIKEQETDEPEDPEEEEEEDDDTTDPSTPAVTGTPIPNGQPS